MVQEKRVELGLGGADRESTGYVRPSDARKIAFASRHLARSGADPRRMRIPALAEAQAATLAENAPRWSAAGRAAEKWEATMRDYVLPEIGGVPVSEIGRHDIKRALSPIAAAGKMDTARRPGDRIARRVTSPTRALRSEGLRAGRRELAPGRTTLILRPVGS